MVLSHIFSESENVPCLYQLLFGCDSCFRVGSAVELAKDAQRKPRKGTATAYLHDIKALNAGSEWWRF